MVAYRDCKGHLVCMADAQTGIVEIQHKDRAVRMTVPVGDSFTVTLRDTETVMTRISTSSDLPCFRKNVPCCCLDDVLHELGSVAFQPQPLFLFADTFIGNRLIAEAVQTHFRLHIHEPSAGRQHHEHHAALIIEANAVCFCGSSLSNAGGSCFVHIPPELCNMGVGQTPGIHQRFQFFFL